MRDCVIPYSGLLFSDTSAVAEHAYSCGWSLCQPAWDVAGRSIATHERDDMKHYPAMMGAALLALAMTNAHARKPEPAPGFNYQFRTGAGSKGRQNGDAELRVVRREHTGRAIGLQIAAGLLGGGAMGFSKNQLHGERIKAIPNPGADILQDALRAQVEEWQVRNPQHPLEQPLIVDLQGGEWVLMYQELDQTETPYELRYSIRIDLKSPSRGLLKGSDSYGSLTCAPAPVVQTYPAWADGDFAGVRDVRERYAAECAQQFGQLLPQWMQVVGGAGGNPVVVQASAEAVRGDMQEAVAAVEEEDVAPTAPDEAPGEPQLR